jgi:hypothetical protein
MKREISKGGKMKAPRTIATCLALLIVMTVSAQAASGIQGKKQEAKPPAKSGMPKEVAALIQEGLVTRQGRQDIPFTFFKKLVLPAQNNNLYPIFFFTAKNGDLGYAPSATGSGEMETTLNAFFQFFQQDAAGALKPYLAGKPSAALKTAGEGYDPEAQDWYSFGLTMPSGTYTLALVLASPDLKKMSVAYSDITLPGPESFQNALWSTEPVIIKALAQVEPDQRPTIHRGAFLWGALQVAANVAGETAVGENLEILFFVLGAAAKDPTAPRPVNDLEVNFEVQSADGKPAIKWAPQPYESFFINQPLPLLQTLQTTDEKGTVVKEEKRPLPAGKYVLVCQITDKVAGTKTDTKVAFEVK